MALGLFDGINDFFKELIVLFGAFEFFNIGMLAFSSSTFVAQYAPSSFSSIHPWLNLAALAGVLLFFVQVGGSGGQPVMRR